MVDDPDLDAILTVIGTGITMVAAAVALIVLAVVYAGWRIESRQLAARRRSEI